MFESIVSESQQPKTSNCHSIQLENQRSLIASRFDKFVHDILKAAPEK